jgi:hypothetical protein
MKRTVIMPAGFCCITQQYEESIIQAGVPIFVCSHLMQQHLKEGSFIGAARI